MLHRISDGRTDLVFDYLAEGHAATETNEHGTPLIRLCAHHGDVSAIRYLLQNGETMQSLGDGNALNDAAFHGHWQLCQFLIENGADVNHQLADTGEAPLHAASSKANRPIYDHVVEILLAGGANPNAATKPGVPTGAFMRDSETKAETPLHRAAAFGTLRAVNLLLEAGAERRAKDINGESPLSWASWHLRPAAVLKALCYDDYSIHPENNSCYDHGSGWNQIDAALRGRPHV